MRNPMWIKAYLSQYMNEKSEIEGHPHTCLRVEMTTEAPSKMNLYAMVKPMPWVEAVTMATLPSNLLAIFGPSILFGFLMYVM